MRNRRLAFEHSLPPSSIEVIFPQIRVERCREKGGNARTLFLAKLIMPGIELSPLQNKMNSFHNKMNHNQEFTHSTRDVKKPA
jgi:hypothetical protein